MKHMATCQVINGNFSWPSLDFKLQKPRHSLFLQREGHSHNIITSFGITPRSATSVDSLPGQRPHRPVPCGVFPQIYFAKSPSASWKIMCFDSPNKSQSTMIVFTIASSKLVRTGGSCFVFLVLFSWRAVCHCLCLNTSSHAVTTLYSKLNRRKMNSCFGSSSPSLPRCMQFQCNLNQTCCRGLTESSHTQRKLGLKNELCACVRGDAFIGSHTFSGVIRTDSSSADIAVAKAQTVYSTSLHNHRPLLVI